MLRAFSRHVFNHVRLIDDDGLEAGDFHIVEIFVHHTVRHDYPIRQLLRKVLFAVQKYDAIIRSPHTFDFFFSPVYDGVRRSDNQRRPEVCRPKDRGTSLADAWLIGQQRIMFTLQPLISLFLVRHWLVFDIALCSRDIGDNRTDRGAMSRGREGCRFDIRFGVKVESHLFTRYRL